jgi:DNA-binding transcriptional ArsR family regulator
MLSATKIDMNAEQEIRAERRAAICSIFANAKRVLILWSLAEQEKSVTEIALAIGASLQSTSQHLGLMKRHSILESRREGQTVYYRIAQNVSLQGCVLMGPRKRRNQQEKV